SFPVISSVCFAYPPYSVTLFFFLIIPPPPISTLFPYTTLFRSINGHIKFNLTIPLQQLNGLETLVIIMVANKYAFSCCSGIVRRSEERFSRNAETDLVCRLLLEKKQDHSDGDQDQRGEMLYAAG